MPYLLLGLAFALLLAGAIIFTNAVEWAGLRLGLGSGAVGSLLDAVATALPESVIPIVAILGSESTGQVAIGAIIDAPFLLGTGKSVSRRTRCITRTFGMGKEVGPSLLTAATPRLRAPLEPRACLGGVLAPPSRPACPWILMSRERTNSPRQ